MHCQAAVSELVVNPPYQLGIGTGHVLQGERDAELFRPLDFGAGLRIASGVDLEFGRAWHILGSAWAHLTLNGRTAVVSGDLGRDAHRVLLPPQPRPDCDALLIESTYGDRRHDDAAAVDTFAATIRRTAARGGSVLIPAFAVDRTEVILVELARLMRSGEIPDLPVFVDSPMALASLRVYRQAIAKSWPEVPSSAMARTRSILAGCPSCTRRRSRCRSMTRVSRRSSSRRPAWPPAAECCTT